MSNGLPFTLRSSLAEKSGCRKLSSPLLLLPDCSRTVGNPEIGRVLCQVDGKRALLRCCGSISNSPPSMVQFSNSSPQWYSTTLRPHNLAAAASLWVQSQLFSEEVLAVARFSAKLRCSYYPLPITEAGKIRNLLHFPAEPCSALDPCAGEGAAFAAITRDSSARR